MAMKKEIVKDSGLVATYHKIESIAINLQKEQCVITIKEYLDETYRNKAKELKEISDAIEEIHTQLTKLDATNEALAEALLEKEEILLAKKQEIANSDYHIGENIVTLDYIPEDVTVAGFYTELKRIDMYADAEEV